MKEHTRQQVIRFCNKCLLNSFMLWILLSIFGKIDHEGNGVGTFIAAGLIFSIVNSLVRPILTILSLPIIILTLGLFTLIVNGVVVWISIKLASNVSISFFNAIIVGLIMSLCNYVLSSLEEKETA